MKRIWAFLLRRRDPALIERDVVAEAYRDARMHSDTRGQARHAKDAKRITTAILRGGK